MANGTMNKAKLVSHIAGKIDGAAGMTSDALRVAIVNALLDTEEEATTNAAAAVTAHLGDYCGNTGGAKLVGFVRSVKVELGLVAGSAARGARQRDPNAIQFKRGCAFRALTEEVQIAAARAFALGNSWLSSGAPDVAVAAMRLTNMGEMRLSRCGRFIAIKPSFTGRPWTLLRIDGGKCIVEKRIAGGYRYLSDGSYVDTYRLARGYTVARRSLEDCRAAATETIRNGEVLAALGGAS